MHRPLFLLLTLLLLANSHPLLAAEPTPSEISDADLRQALLTRLETDYQLHVDNPERFATADLQSLLAGASALPRSAWTILNQPVRLEYRPRPCLGGIGRYTNACPTFEEDRRQEHPRFFIYDSPPLLGEGPLEALAILTAEEQRDIQLRRAVIHLAIALLDRKLEWSKTHAWRSINGWPTSGNALNLDPYGYSRPLGMRSALLDLITFAEEYFLRPEDLLLQQAAHGDRHAQSRLLHDFDPDLSVTCQQFTKRRIFTALFQQLDPLWLEPIRLLPHMQAGQPQCPAFEEWSRPELLDGFDILLAAPTSNKPESLYGHLLLHVRYKSDGRVRGEGFEPVYQFGAVTDTNVSPVTYFTRGLLGGFPSILEFNTFRGVDRIFLQYQQRALSRYSLQLSDDEGRQLLERIWEAERRIRYPYIFLPNNCASFLIDLISPVVDPTLFEEQARIVMPTDVLDTLARARNLADEPLLVKRPDSLRSNRQIAEAAILERRFLFQDLQQRLSDLPNELDYSLQLSGLQAGFEHQDPRRRADAFDNAHALFEDILAMRPELADPIIDIIYTGVLVERYFMELANYARRTVYLNAGSSPEHQTIAEILATRRALYRHEDLDARIRALNERAGELEAQIAPDAEHTFPPSQQEILEHEARTRITYRKALRTQSSLIADHLPDWNGIAYLEKRSQRYLDDRTRVDALSLGPSGRHRLTLGAGFDAALALPTLEFSYSALEDRLGEVRRRGYPGHLESRILGLDAVIPLDVGSFPGLSFDLTLFRYLSIERSYAPIETGLFGNVGWALDIGLLHDSRRKLNAGLRITPSLLFPLFTARDHVHHLVLETGLAARHDIHRANDPHLGLRIGLFGQIHLSGSYANVLRFGFHTAQFLTLGPQWAYDYAASLQARQVLFHVDQRPLVAIPFLEAARTSRTYTGDDHFDSWRAGLKVELPF